MVYTYLYSIYIGEFCPSFDHMEPRILCQTVVAKGHTEDGWVFDPLRSSLNKR